MAVDIATLISALSWWELAGYVTVAAVAVGVAGESVHELTDWLGTYSWWKAKGGKASAFLLIMALVAELVIQIKVNSISGEIIADLSDQAAEARKEAATLEREAAQLRVDLEKERGRIASRVVTETLFGAIQHLRGHLTAVSVTWENCNECALLGSQLLFAFDAAGIKTTVFPSPSGAWTGILVASVDLPKNPLDDPLIAALNEAGLWGGATGSTQIQGAPVDIPQILIGEKFVLFDEHHPPFVGPSKPEK
jgi:hypothetical protein